MASRTYKLFMEARRAALVASGRLESTEAGELVPEGVAAWTWAHSRAFADAAFHDANRDTASAAISRLRYSGRS